MANTRTSVAKSWLKASLWLIGIATLMFAVNAIAGDEKGIGSMAKKITESFRGIGELMIAVSYIAGIAFAIAAVFKFKQHKDNPTQIPLGTPLAMLFIGIFLIFLPAFIEPAGHTIFGEEGAQKAGGFTGAGAEHLPAADK